MEGNKIKLAVVGSRSIKNKKLVFNYLDKHKDRIDYIISGGAIGPDTFANEWCKENGYPIKIHYPNWNEGKGAGFKRNCDIIRECTFAIIFWDGSPKGGTKHDIDLCQDFGKKHRVVICND